MAKILSRRTAKQVELASVNPDHEMRVIPAGSIDWIARILWASQ
jgi:phage repressor protein C with HTH and peptisase S24 domain